MIDDDSNTNYEEYLREERHARFFVGWLTGYFIFGVAALVSALMPPLLPNCSLLLYGFSVICGWQMLPYIEYYMIKFLDRKDRCLIGWAFVFSACFFFYAGCVSAFATFALFPHPNLLGRFSKIPIPLHLPTFVYLPALVVALLVAHRGYLISRGHCTEKLNRLAKNHALRRTLFMRWIAKTFETYPVNASPEETLEQLRNAQNIKVFNISWKSFLYTRLFSIWLLLLAIPAWIFIGIPLQTFSSFSAIPMPYLIAMALTSGAIALWLGGILISLVYRYEVSETGILQKGFFHERGILWCQIVSAFLREETLILEDLKGNRWKVSLKDFKTPIPLWQKALAYLHITEDRIWPKEGSIPLWQEALAYLPLEILLISESGWKYLSKILPPQGMEDFVARYQKAWSAEVEEEGRERKRRKKKGRKK